jgi:hypothetical protein
VNIEPEWFPEPGELIEPGEPPKPKPDLREFFKLGKPPESAASTPLWSGAPPPPPPAPMRPAEYLAARKAFRLAWSLRNSRMLLATFRWYDAHLILGEGTILPWPPKRGKGRKLNFYWLYYLKAARRVFKLRCERVLPTETLCEYYIRHPVWAQLQLQFGFENDPKMNFLWEPEVEAKFKQLKPDFKITAPELVKLDREIGSLLLEKTREYLLRDIDRETQEMFEREEAAREASRHTAAKSKPKVSATTLPPKPEPGEISVKDFTKSFLNKIRYA